MNTKTMTTVGQDAACVLRAGMKQEVSMQLVTRAAEYGFDCHRFEAVRS
ncbi:hypothetical protein [Bosea lathyri]|uniref:Uncharacterized protein n=1 Tax=Bosea lathyri TaxID=1036778 RepID=A0A1H6DA70_9HYPH|nr:hypothetical protein [Bosea lathyri]SEG81426.1 hypothetical protein SAMN04488115_11834 [Bosea lathyri]